MGAISRSSMRLARIAQSEVSALKGSTVLVYSSNQTFRDYYRSMSFLLGFRPVTATKPVAAKAILRLMNVTLIVLDGDEGIEGCGGILQDARELQPQSPVVVVSSKLCQDFFCQVESLGAAEFLRHPAPADAIVRALVSGRPGAKELVHSSPSSRMSSANAAGIWGERNR
jgi:DNA-binding NtrC family response regulator